jgi:hypothetical protein
VEQALAGVAEHHVEARALVGRDLSDVLRGSATADEKAEPIFYMSEDRITSGLRQRGLVSNEPFTPVTGAASVEMVVAQLPTGTDDASELWKLAHYYDQSPTDPTDPDDPDDVRWELHDLSGDPEERTNLAVERNASARTNEALALLRDTLSEQREQRRLTPRLVNPT